MNGSDLAYDGKITRLSQNQQANSPTAEALSEHWREGMKSERGRSLNCRAGKGRRGPPSPSHCTRGSEGWVTSPGCTARGGPALLTSHCTVCCPWTDGGTPQLRPLSGQKRTESHAPNHPRRSSSSGRQTRACLPQHKRTRPGKPIALVGDRAPRTNKVVYM